MSIASDRSSQVLDRLFEVIEERRAARPAGSYVVSLLDGGIAVIGAKVLEEAEEVVRAAASEGDEAVAHEAADLVFHLLVLLSARGVEPGAVHAELARRFGIGGHAEKASRATAATRDGQRGRDAHGDRGEGE
jgi:phosphoribosyl-ATP pyrophosphohydrolase